MNALNLKITGDTKKKGKKKEMPEDVSIFYAKHGSCKTVLDLLSSASSLEAQIACLKSNLLSADNVQNNCEVFDLLLDMIFLMNTKSPLRIAILKQLSVVEGIRNCLIQERLVRFIREKIDTNEMESVGRFLNFLSVWLENPSVCRHLPLEIIHDLVVPYLKRVLNQFLADLSTEMPPTTKLQVLDILHCNVRCLLTIFQKFYTSLSTDLLDSMVTCLRNDQLPLDTRANCGILFALGFKANDSLGNEISDIVNNESDPQAMLCVSGGFLNVLGPDSLSQFVLFDGEPVSILQYLLQKIINCEESNPADCTIVLSSSRCLLVGTKCLVASPDLLTKTMLTALLNYIWNHLEHYMDAVRHLASSSLTNVVAAGKKMEEGYIFEAITHDIETMASDRRSKHVAISALLGNLPIRSLLAKSPDLVATLLESAKSSPSANHAICSFESLMVQHYQEKESFEEWFTLWVDPVIRIFGSRPNAALEHILNAVMKLNPDVVRRISEMEKSDGLDLTSILLICLRIGKKLGVLKLEKDERNLSELMDYKMLAKNVYHLNGDVRIACFALITETQKLSEEFTADELEVVKLFLTYNMSNHCAAERQKTLAYFKKFIARLKLLLDQREKQLSKQQKSAVDVVDQRFELYRNFVSWLRQFCIDSLFPGANFARRCTALNLLTLCREFGLWDGPGQSEENCSVLMRCFLDSYEENKILAKKLLAEVPAKTLKFDNSDYLKRYLDSAVRLASSVRPIDSQSAAYFVSLLAAFPSVAALLFSAYQQESIFKDRNVHTIPDPSRYICCSVVLAKLKCELSIAKKSLLKAASSGPLYGQLFVLRNVIKEAIFFDLVDSQEWKCLIQEMLSIAYDCNGTVACVVNSSSPEGHLPMDFDYDVEELRGSEDCSKVTAQMVLLSSWRTVKEVSLLLGELSETVPISTQDDPGLISEEQVLEIGEHLSNLLAETKHRGAFEQAYVGFCKLASRLWRYPKGNLHELPGRWLAETLDEISNNQKLSATRRSAGIPFRIQGLVCTELEVGRGKCFHRGIKTLLELAGNPENPTETKCHALNILRALYRHTLLGEMVSPYVADGLSIAIEGFNASTWAERNSSTLLMSALMTRIFGVPRSRSENLCWKNKMTGRIFFQRYPSLFGILLRHLELASQKSLYPATYPVLLVLGRLYPSSLEGTDTNLQLNKFIPLVYKCSGSNILKTRSLAASAMVALVTPNLFVDHIDGIFSTLGISTSENFTHGLLLQVLELFRSSDLLPDSVMLSLNQKLPIWTDRIVSLLKSKRSSVTKTACVSILLQWVTNFFNNLKSLDELADLLFEEINNEETERHFGASTYALYSTTLMLTVYNYQRRDKEIVTRVRHLLSHRNYDVRNITLDFVRSVLTAECQNGIKNEFLQSAELAESVLARYETDSHHEDHVELLTVMSHLPAVFRILDSRKISIVQYFSSTIHSKPESLGSLAFKCISSCTNSKKQNLGPQECSQLCRIVDMYSLPSCENSCRSFVAEFLRTNFDWLLEICADHDRLTVWTSALRLLNDDDCDIREALSSAFCTDVIPYVSLEKFFDKLAGAELEPQAKCCLLLGWAFWNCNLDDFDSEDVSECVFEKGDMNTYLEEINITNLACRHLGSIVADNPGVIAAQLPDYCASWISSLTNLTFSGSNCLEIIDEFKSQIGQRCSYSSSQSPFRHNEVSLHLLSQKLERILKSVQL
ncbi:Putative death-receptor fusion protein (DUF2428) [Nesidiocoris tenuis]|uniref:tRNA (32-2'-O)-methyltransferase regulator THADA n=1 Tax=Nesidiocoris tenuis TaxID=355587 RepID=A0ABN7BA65_9HEMI|nr:Putative death-receptor fusion protein (DUF2428) [Nesidiocoris tenuis]